MIPFEWIDQADERIAPHIVRTPLTHDAARNLYIKWENRQKTGSFKARGTLNKVLSLESWKREVGIVTASAGNHGQGVALAGQLTKARVTCFVSEHAVPVKVDAIRALGAEIVEVAGVYPEAEAAGRKIIEENHKTWVSPYNDELVIAGQGTIELWARSFGFMFGEYHALHPHISNASREQVQRAHRLKRRVHVWTANTPEEIIRLKEWGADGIFTDDPQMAAQALGRSG